MKSSFSGGLHTWVWGVFPILCLIPPIVFGLIILEKIKFDTDIALVVCVLVYGLPLVWAYINGLKSRKRLRLEHRLLRKVSFLANEQRKKIINRNGKQLLDIPKNERDPDYYLGGEGGAIGSETSASLMVQQLVKNAEEMRRDSDLTSQVFIRALIPLKTAVSIPQQVALRVGILCTFVGLMIGLGPLAGMFQGAAGAGEIIGDLITGLTLAFGTSIAGLTAALMIQILVALVDREYALATQQLESTWMDLGHVLSYVRLEGDLPANVDRLSEEIKHHSEDVNVHTRNLIDQVDRMLLDSKEQIRVIGDSHRVMSQYQSAFKDFSDRHRGETEQFLKSMQDFENRWQDSLDRMVRQSEEKNRERDERLTREIQSSVAGLNSTLGQNFNDLQKCLEDAVQNLARDKESTSEAFGNAVNELKIHLDREKTSFQDKLASLGSAETKSTEINENKELNHILEKLSVQLDGMPAIPAKPSKLWGVTAGLIGGVFACVTLILSLAIIGEPAQQRLSNMHSFIVGDAEDESE